MVADARVNGTVLIYCFKIESNDWTDCNPFRVTHNIYNWRLIHNYIISVVEGHFKSWKKTRRIRVRSNSGLGGKPTAKENEMERSEESYLGRLFTDIECPDVVRISNTEQVKMSYRAGIRITSFRAGVSKLFFSNALDGINAYKHNVRFLVRRKSKWAFNVIPTLVENRKSDFDPVVLLDSLSSSGESVEVRLRAAVWRPLL